MTVQAIKPEAGTTLGHYINGQVVADDNRPLPVYNPATGEACRHVAMASQATVQQAIAAAHAAFPAWRDTPPLKRARIMFRFKQLLEQHADEIVALLTAEHGKVLDDARGEFGRGVEVVEYACAAPELLKGEHTKNVGPNIDSWSEQQPLGVVAGITPFNFPAMVPMWMYPLAIVCGNTFVLKPSEKDPSAPLRCAQLLGEAGLPDGVLNVVNGDKEAVDTLLTHKDVEAVSFVGSTAVAEYIYQTGTSHGKRVQALGGAKNHAVVMPDADMENAAAALMGAAFGSCGERCMAISVAVCVGEQTADTIVSKLQQRIAELKVGDGTDPGSDMGPLISAPHFDKVKGYVDTGVSEGAELVVDGRGLKVSEREDGYFLGACLFDQVKPGMSIYEDEIFGPVLCVVRVDSQEEAMRLIDAHEYGNGTCIFTRDGEAARYFSDNIRVGMVGINVPLPVPVATHSFGGWKRSLFGDLYAYGPDAIRFYTRRKTITQRWPSGGVREKANFSFPSNN
ncbi:MAG: CoA-acylating methylmalonate-semialdehyde dehydrogenase [Gammaproteobacteria bacterium]|nr:CoA-acylating methylmalonate-semialdehyde dehydrogenase [Gammaproteobacteria bacterium]NNF61158.1 CoA-acylating methylmalonate-semialdehyde dehydrogenase [Gammaproteobacteria bacterium]NNM19752.1 CoA-acylating methylmalonate-semialdehyde dehydrogenase [Gammaproteobacteria bacterium]